MASFFTKLKPTTAAQNAANNASPHKKNKEEPVAELTPLEKMLLSAGPIRDDGTDKFFGLENFGNTCYCNSMVQVLYHTESFRENVIRFPPYSPADTPNGKPKAVPVRIRPAPDPAATAAATGAAAGTPGSAAAAGKKPGSTPQQRGQRQPASPGQLANGQIVPMRPEDRPDSPEYKKKQAMIKGPILELTDNASAYGMEECTFTSVKDIFMAFIESNSRTGVLSPNRLLEIFRQENDMFRTAMHQDAHEFYGLVLNDIIKTVEDVAVKRRQQKDIGDNAGLKQSITAALSNGNSNFNGSASNALSRVVSSLDGTSTPGSGWVHDIFEGVLTSETRCLTCETASQRDETFLDLSIDLEEHSSVTSCLRKFSAEEMLCERNKFHCDRCGGLQEAEKRMKIKRLPRILALHLKRFKYSEDYTKLEKLFHRVVYPYHLRMFNTTEDAEDPDRLYELYAVVVHIGGNAYHGHYVSVIKTSEHGWLLFDDEMVEPVDKHFVRNFFGDKPGTACAYVLFYQETTFEKVQAEQEREGLEEIKLASQSAGLGLALSPDGHASGGHHTNGVNGMHLWKQSTVPALATPTEMPDEFVSLEHAKTAPGMEFASMSSAPLTASSPQTTAATGGGGGVSPSVDKTASANAKAEAARQKEEREREKKEAKAQEKARKAQEKEQAKEQDRQRKEREKELEAQRKAETEELRKAIAASKQSAADEKEARKKSLDGADGSGGGKGAGFLSRSARGSKSMSRRSFGFLGKDKDKERAKLVAAESPFVADQASTSNGSANGGGSSNGSSAQLAAAAHAPAVAIPPVPPIPAAASAPSAPSSPAVQPTWPATPAAQQQQQQQPDKAAGRNRFSINLGRKKSSGRL